MSDSRNETPKEAAARLTVFARRDGFIPQAMYSYKDKDGETLFFRLRLEKPNGGKRIYPISHNGKGWELKEPDFPPSGKPLYKLPEIIKNPEATVWVVEGENKVEALAELGIIATTTGGTTSAGKADWETLRGRDVVVWPDNDEPGAKYADEVTEILRGLGCKVERVNVSELGLPDKGDAVDYLKANPGATKADIENLALVQTQTGNGTTSVGEPATPPDDEAYLTDLAQLGPIEYDQVRDEASKKLGIRVATLDAVVATRRPTSESNNTTSGSTVLFNEPEPWPEPVNGRDLLDDLAGLFKRYVALPEGAAESAVLWVLHSYTLDAVFTSPILAITSPQKRCGKTTLLSILGSLVFKPLPASNITAAALFRAVEKWGPTLLIDEADSFLKNSDELRGVLNSGHTRNTAYVIRTVGDENEPKTFSTWSPKVIALIGSLPGTLEDRALVIPMRRKRPDEMVAKLRADRMDSFQEIARRCVRWAMDNLDTLKSADPEVPSCLNDRAADNWRPLLAIADVVGGAWPTKARSVAEILSGDELEDEAAAVMLLEDIRNFFKEKNTERLPSANIVEKLIAMEERPWPEWRRGKPLTTRQLARLLKPFGIRPKTFRDGYETHKGYLKGDFNDAFSRYLPVPFVTSVTSLKNKSLEGNSSVTQSGDVTDKNLCNSHKINNVTDVTDGAGVIQGGEGMEPGGRECFDL